MANMMQNLQNMQPQQGMQNQGNWWAGIPARNEQTPILNQGQQGAQNQALQQLMAMLQGNGQAGYEGFQPIEDRAREQFATQTIPGLAERFTSAGTQRSGAYKNALNSQGREFELGLGALKSQYGMQKFGQLANIGFQPSFENNYFKRQPGFGETAGQPILQGIGAALPLIGSAFGPAGTAGGAGLGALLQLLSSYIGQQGQQQAQQVPQQMQLGGGAQNNLMSQFGVKPLNFGGMQ
jgi:hypothetical protein